LRLAIFGGTFDPVHNGHLAIAREAADKFSLDLILFIPAYQPPHKTGGPAASYEDRYRMVELACAADVRFLASKLELGAAPSYAIDTIHRARAEYPATGPLFFILGADAFAEIQTWYRQAEVIRQVEFIVISRPGYTFGVPNGAKVHRLDNLEIPISSTEIRRRLAASDLAVPVPKDVREYIDSHGLYRTG
jgi:nicotinate-nucleotide adenylyltransferase